MVQNDCRLRLKINFEVKADKAGKDREKSIGNREREEKAGKRKES